MSGDIATLGLSVDSRQVVAAKTALDGLTAAAKPAAAAAAALEKSTASAGKGAAAMATGTGLARHEMINLSRQIQDVGVSLASGQSPFLVAIQQGTQMADIFGSSKTATVGGALKQIVTGIGVARLAALGFVGVVAGAAFAVKSISDSAKAFDDLARSVDASRGQLNLLQQAASFKGIGSDDFAKGMQRFGASVYDAKNNMGGLAEVMRANGKSASDFTGYMETAADLIKNAGSDQARLQLLQQMGLPATMEWVKFLSQGKDGIRAATAEAVKFNESAEGKMIAAARSFDDAWNKATTNFVNRFKSGIIEIVGAMAGVQVPQWMLNIGRGAAGGVLGGPLGIAAGAIRGGMQGNDASFGDRFGQFAPTGNAGALQNGLTNRANTLNGSGPTVNKNVLQNDIARMQPLLGLFGQTPAAKQAQQQTPKDQERDSDHMRLPKAA